MTETKTHRIVYKGPAPFASAVAQTLEQDGLEVTWTPPEERRGMAETFGDAVVVDLIVRGLDAVFDRSVAKIKERLRGRATVDEAQDEGENPE